MKNKITTVGIILIAASLSLFTTTLDIFGPDTLLAGFVIMTIAIFLRILPRQIASVWKIESLYSFSTNRTSLQDELMELTITFRSDGSLRPKLAEREVIICPPRSNPMNWVNTPTHISMRDSVTFKFVETNHGSADVEIGETYGPFNAQLKDTPNYLEVYDYFTNEKVGVISVNQN